MSGTKESARRHSPTNRSLHQRIKKPKPVHPYPHFPCNTATPPMPGGEPCRCTSARGFHCRIAKCSSKPYSFRNVRDRNQGSCREGSGGVGCRLSHHQSTSHRVQGSVLAWSARTKRPSRHLPPHDCGQHLLLRDGHNDGWILGRRSVVGILRPRRHGMGDRREGRYALIALIPRAISPSLVQHCNTSPRIHDKTLATKLERR